jgi:DNA-binding MarR family transcriptional regulator
MSDATNDVAGSAVLHGTTASNAPEPDAATRIWAAMSDLVLNQEDRRKEITDTLDMSFFRAKALRRLLPGPLTMRELTARLHTEKPYTTLVVDDLERRGYVERTVHPEDRRCKIVSLTPTGAAVARQAEDILARPPRCLLALEPEELAALDRIMAKLRSPDA